MNNLDQLITVRQTEPIGTLIPNIQSLRSTPKQNRPPIDKDLNKKIIEVLKQIQEKSGFPIAEIVAHQNSQDQNYINYRILGKAAKEYTLTNVNSIGFGALRSAYGEAIMLKELREQLGADGLPAALVVYEPADVFASKEVVKVLKRFLNVEETARKVSTKFGKKTPDILFIESPRYHKISADETKFSFGKIKNVIDTVDPKFIKTKQLEFRKQTLIEILEITTSASANNMNEKAKKIQSYRNPFSKDPLIAYVPTLLLDHANFKGLEDEPKEKLVNSVYHTRGVTGIIALYHNLVINAIDEAIKTAGIITTAVNKRAQLITNPITLDISLGGDSIFKI